MNPAHNGAAKLVPQTRSAVEPFQTITKFSATIATSGKFLMVVDPRLADMSRPCCQLGIG